MMDIFGPVRQLGFISRDMERSLSHFVEEWGIGPWYVLRNLPSPMIYKGDKVDLDLTIAMANSGSMQFEIVVQNNTGTSMYTDALAMTDRLHLQHLAVWTNDVDGVEARAAEKGWETMFETLSGPGRSVFVTHPDGSKLVMEISDSTPFKEDVRQAICDIARDWDGSDPIREGLPDLPKRD